MDHITPRESEILLLIVEGLNNTEIGVRLGISSSTVRNYVSRLFNKLNVSRRAELGSSAPVIAASTPPSISSQSAPSQGPEQLPAAPEETEPLATPPHDEPPA